MLRTFQKIARPSFQSPRSAIPKGALFGYTILALFLNPWFTNSWSQDKPPLDKPIYNSEPAHLQPTTPLEALAKMELPPGFRAELYAHEPDIQNPIAMAWDHRGRMWVAENYTYAEASLRFDLDLHDRVIILEDRDQDGHAETRKVFSDKVQMLTSLEVGKGGVWLMCPPQLLFIPDRNNDDLPDGPPQVMLDGFEVGKGSHHNFANGLRWGPDGWLYGRCGHSCPAKIGLPGSTDEQRVPMKGGIWRFHPERNQVEVVVHGTTNPWGHDWDARGEGFFINTVNGHLWHLIPGAHFKESFGTPLNPGVYDRIDSHADHWHFDTKGSWQASRDGKANDFGGGHAHIGMMIYQADQWPSNYRDKLMTCNFHGRSINVEKLEREGSGYVGHHEPNMMTAGDPWFRGMEISAGPDGAGYVLDWSDTGECHENSGVHRTSGRIYRISHNAKPSTTTPIHTIDSSNFESYLRHNNVWYERQSRMLLGELPPSQVKSEIVNRLRQIIQDDQDEVIQLRALWSLVALRECNNLDLIPLLNHRSEHLQTWAIRLLTDQCPIDTADGRRPGTNFVLDTNLLSKLNSMAESDPSGLVRLTLASTLQRLPVGERKGIAIGLLRHESDAVDHNLPFLVWYGLIPLVQERPLDLIEIAKVGRWPTLHRWLARNLAENVNRHPAVLSSILSMVAKQNRSMLPYTIEGLEEGFQGRQKIAPPACWEEVLAASKQIQGEDQSKLQGRLTSLSLLFGDGRALEAVLKVARDNKGDIAVRGNALQTIIDSRSPETRKLCESLLDTRTINVVALKGLVLFDDPAIGETLIKKYRSFLPHERSNVIDALTSRAAWSQSLLREMENKSMDKSEMNPMQARQILNLGDEALSKKLRLVWGDIRDSDSDRRNQIQQLKTELTTERLRQGDLSVGKGIFLKTCSNCHILYGSGKSLGPNLTGSGRGNLDYLLENIVDPSAVVSADYRLSVIAMEDGRVITGIVVKETDGTLIVRLANEEVAIAKSEIEKRSLTNKSMMPDNLLEALNPEQIRDLFAYLMHSTQVP